MIGGVLLILQKRNPAAFNQVPNAASMVILLFGIVGFAPFPAHADGGAVQFQKSTGPFVITVFTTPTPLRVGAVDFSLMIQSRENQQPVLDCQALVQLHKEGAMSIRCEATHEAAQNKLLYAAQVNIPEPGEWELEAVITRRDDSVSINGPIAVSCSSTLLFTYWRGLAFPPVLILLFVLNQWVKRR